MTECVIGILVHVSGKSTSFAMSEGGYRNASANSAPAASSSLAVPQTNRFIRSREILRESYIQHHELEAILQYVTARRWI